MPQEHGACNRRWINNYFEQFKHFTYKFLMKLIMFPIEYEH
jgi:hypothetical protein